MLFFSAAKGEHGAEIQTRRAQNYSREITKSEFCGVQKYLLFCTIMGIFID